MASLTQTRLTANALLREHGLAQQGWTFEFDNAVNRGGQCRYSSKTISMSRKLVPLWEEDQVRQTLLHEIAHALTKGHHHDAVWMAKAVSIGFTRGTRTHSNATPPKKWLVLCGDCGEIGKVHRRKTNACCARCYKRGRINPTSYVLNPEALSPAR